MNALPDLRLAPNPNDTEAEPPPPPLFADRVRVYPKAVQGTVRQVKWAVLFVCLAIYYLLPWVRWPRGPGRPNQAVLLDLSNERFYFFNVELWPQDIYYLTGFMIMAAIALFLVTSLFGRLWCGFSCPQTVWTDLFIWVERWIEGDRAERMRRDAGAHNAGYMWRKALKHSVWLAIAFWTGGAWIMYYVDAPTLLAEFWTGQASIAVYGFVFLFTATTYVLAGWAREQVCTYMCPWPRFQSAMMDEQSITVTYRAWRGEPRSRHIKRQSAAPAGDCIDCHACVHACPTGIDIRDGVQMECISCGLCVDACNTIMKRVGRPANLIAWDTEARQMAHAKGDQPHRLTVFRARTMIYLGALLLAAGVMGAAFANRAVLGVTVEHDRAPLFVTLRDGSLRNGFNLRVVNKGHGARQFELHVDGLDGARLSLSETAAVAPGQPVTLPVPSDGVANFRVLVAGPAPEGGRRELTFSVRDPVTGAVATGSSAFLGPVQGAAR